MFAPRVTAPTEIAPVAIAGYLQLAGLLIIAIAAREIESSAGPVGDHPLMILALLTGAATFAGATFLRRFWKQAAVPPPRRRDGLASAKVSSPARDRGGPADADFAPADEETWRWRSGAEGGASDPRRAVARENDQGATVGTPR